MAAKIEKKVWYDAWQEGEAIAPLLNTLEGLGHTIFQVIYIRYSKEGKTGYRVIYFRMEEQKNVK